MTNFPHDEFAKEYLSEICQNYGETIASADIKSEKRQVDILFTPTKEVPTTPTTLGLLGKILQKSCLLEIYRNPIQPQQIRECLNKLFDVQLNKIREAKREKREKKSVELPILWIITPTISEKILAGFGATPKEEWNTGIYFLPPELMTGIVAVHQLEVLQETLWLRILGRGKVQANAVEELKSLPENYPYREIVLELIYGLWNTLQRNQANRESLETQDIEVIMSLRNIYRQEMAKLQEEATQEGIQEGIQQNLKNNIISILEKRFQIIPSELTNLINSISDIPKLQNLLLETISVSSLDEFEDLILSDN